MDRLGSDDVDSDKIGVGIIVESMRLQDIGLVLYESHDILLQFAQLAAGVDGIYSDGADDAMLTVHLLGYATGKPVDLTGGHCVEDIDM